MFKQRLLKLFGSSIKSLIGVIFIITTLMPGRVVADPANNDPVSIPITEWTLNVQAPMPSAETLKHGVKPPDDRHFTDLVGKLRDRGLSVTVTPLPGEGKAGRPHLKAAGKHDLDDFRRIFHDVMKPEINSMGGVAEMEIESTDTGRQTLVIVMESNPSTGYAWHLLSGGAFIESESTSYQMHTLGYGVPQRQILRLKRGSNGIGPIRLVHKRHWEESPATFRLTHRLSSLPEKLDLSDPNTPATLATPRVQPYINDTSFPVLEAGRGLPAQWDWRSQGIVTPIRNQASCGSCWAFGTVGIMESALWINGVANQNLSEQYLISCNKDGWSCDGGWTAHKYHYDTLGTNQTIVGAVLEADKPYTATNGTCTAGYNHPYKLNGWQFVTGSELTIPTVDQIKNAIYTYGPITAGVCVGNAFQSYQPGTVFATNETSGCYGYTNHQIILVGWDDPGQYWILRNSWGTGWGESGYMRIRWNTSRVGEGTSWVTVIPPDTIPNQFTFTDQTNVALSTVITSTTITVSGINAAATISITGGTYSINGGAYTSAGGTVNSGNTVTVRLTSSGSYSTTTNATLTIGGVSDTFSVTTLAAPCIYTLNPTSQSFTAWKGSGSVGVTVPYGCPWSAARNASWITIASGGSGNGNGTVNYSVAANNGTISRSGTITIGGQPFTVTQDKPVPITCTGSPARIARTAISYGTLQQAYDAALNNDTIQVQAVELIGNLTVNRSISATLSGGYTCDFGTDTGLYTILKGAVQTLAGGGALTIVNVNIKPNVQPPTVTTGPVTNLTANAATLNGTVNPRSAATTYYFEWGTTTGYGTRNPLTPASAGKGSADVSVSVGLTGLTPNTPYHYRLVAINSEATTNGLDGSFATLCVFTVSPVTAIVTSSSAGYSATVTANSGCNWTAVSNVPAWITVSSGTPGTGNGTVNYTVVANPGKDPRTGTLTIAGQTLTVTQVGAPCSYSLNSASQSFGNWGGIGSVGVTAIGGCAWSSQSNAPWITITSGGSGVGSGTVNYSVAGNSGASRSGTMTIGGSTFTVTQAAGPLSCGVGVLPVRNLNTGVAYVSLQSAYDAAADGHTLQVQGVPITGNLTVNRNITVTVEGGYTCDFGTYGGINTPLTGSIRTMPGGGTLKIKNFQLK